MTPDRWQGPALLAATALAVAGIAWLRTWAAADPGGGWQPAPEVVTITEARARPWQPTRTLLATLAPVASVEVRTEVGGRLVSLDFDSGAAVAAGEVLARLDTAVEEAELRAVTAELRAIGLRRDRLAQLASERGASRMEVDQADADADAATARADALRARIRLKTLVAPFSGRAGVRRHHPGQVVDPGTALTTLVADADAVFADAWVPQNLLPTLSVGTPVSVRLGDVVAPGQIETLEPSGDPTRRAVLVRMRVSPIPVGWLPGLSAQVAVPIGEEAPRVVVPAAALQWSPAGVLVYRAVPAEGGLVAAASPVEVLAELGDEVVLARGLEPGAAVIATGAFKLREGAPVRAAGAPDE